MKYIDADKLLSEINDRIERCEKDEEDGYPDTTSSEATLKSIRSFIASLQQEQPDFPTTDEEIEMLLATHPKIEMPEKYKNPDWLFKQQEMDLEREIDKEWKNCCPVDDGMGDESALLVIEQFHQITRHFYELGLNARKDALLEWLKAVKDDPMIPMNIDKVIEKIQSL